MAASEMIEVEHLVDTLAEIDRGVTRLHVPAGQDLLYPHHQPFGAFILLHGRIDAHSVVQGPHARPTRHVATPGHPVVLVSIGAIERPSEARLTVTEDAELLFVPRSAVLGSTRVRSALTELERRAAP
jgi:hypothetical protein